MAPCSSAVYWPSSSTGLWVSSPAIAPNKWNNAVDSPSSSSSTSSASYASFASFFSYSNCCALTKHLDPSTQKENSSRHHHEMAPPPPPSSDSNRIIENVLITAPPIASVDLVPLSSALHFSYNPTSVFVFFLFELILIHHQQFINKCRLLGWYIPAPPNSSLRRCDSIINITKVSILNLPVWDQRLGTRTENIVMI